MTLTPRRWSALSEGEKGRLLRRSEEAIDQAVEKVRPVVQAVKDQGDRALRELTERFDHARLGSLPLAVTEEEFSKAEKSLSAAVKEALAYSVENVRRFHEPQKPRGLHMLETRPGILAGERATPLDSVGLYVPRGRGSFPSMVYMLAVPAVLAGVPSVALATPPGPDGSVDPACLYAARLAGVSTVYRVGGAQAVAALAYGTESVAAVSKIVGPGSAYVAAAKRLVRDQVDTGLPAGPSESLILADGSEDPLTVCRDLLIEAEHGADSSALLVTTSEALAASVAEQLPRLITGVEEPRRGFLEQVFGGYGGIILAESLEEAAEIANLFAPEHLQLRTRDPFALLARIRNAGEILIGAWTPFSLANYAAGANAVLPTGGQARTYSAVSVRDFMKYSSLVYITPTAYPEIAAHVRVLANYEGFPSHAGALTDSRS